VIHSAYPVALGFAPGERWQYSNLGFFALAEILTRVSGEPWSNFLTERIFRPQHMDATRTTTVSDIVSNRADGYTWHTGKLQRADEYLALPPSGAFLSTVNDLARWDAALYTEIPLTRHGCPHLFPRGAAQ
jgi:CubicO group peptidase (beta-lactamase class C family)